jgi:hypothetical protein
MQWLVFAAIPGMMFILMYFARRVLTAPKQKVLAFGFIQLSGVVAVLVALYRGDDTRPNELLAQFVLSCVLGTLVGGYFFGLFAKR